MKNTVLAVLGLLVIAGCTKKEAHPVNVLHSKKSAVKEVTQINTKSDSLLTTTPDEYFAPIDSSNAEILEVVTLASRENGISDGIRKISDHHYLLYTVNAGRIFTGIYLVNMKTKLVEKLQGGETDTLHLVFNSKKNVKCLLLKSTVLTDGNSWTGITGITIKDTDTTSIISEVLASVQEDGETGGCGNRELDQSGTIDSTVIKNFDKNGFLEVSIFTTLTDCKNGSIKHVQKSFSCNDSCIETLPKTGNE